MNHLAVIAAALSDLLVGAIWYSPPLFARAWRREAGLSEESLRKGNPGLVYTAAFLLALVISYVLGSFLDDPRTDALWGFTVGFLAGIWAAAAFIIVALFERRRPAYFLIHVGYILAAFTLKGLIIGAWR
ncbi:MAG: DUF1761 domain-containing protein [Bacteroidota bacterium]